MNKAKSSQYPTPWQKKVMWASLTGIAIMAIGALSIFLVLSAGKVLGFLQPILIPIAIAAIVAYLLHPVVSMAVKWGLKRTYAVILVFVVFFALLIWLGVAVVPEIYQQSLNFGKEVPGWVAKGKVGLENLQKHYELHGDNPYVHQAAEWLQAQVPELPSRIWSFVASGFQGFLGAFGFIIGLIVVPVYLFFMLMNAESIGRHWGDYLPLRASPLKTELVDCLNEINDYLIAFFRGQIIVTLIDGILLAIGLLILGLPFAMLIGLGVAILQLIPYVGVLLCWIPAVLIAALHFQDWYHPIMVTIMFLVVTNLDGLIIAPRIVGNSVGLHPMTIIVSVFAWSLLVGGLLGALLAVPLTATLKVLLRRYVWERQLERFEQQALPPEPTPLEPPSPPTPPQPA